MKWLRVRKQVVDEDGSVSVEFVILFPVVIGMVLLIFEAGWVMTNIMMLDRGLDIAMRDVRLGKAGSADEDTVKAKICARARILDDCINKLEVEHEPYSAIPGSDWQDNIGNHYPWDEARCQDNPTSLPVNPVSGEVESEWAPGDRDINMFLRVCVTYEPVFPGLGALLLNKTLDDPTNPLQDSYFLVAFSAFRNES